MKLHHLTTQTTDPAERGRAIGRLYGGHIRQSSERYLEHFGILGVPADQVRAIVERSRESLLAWYPSLVVESDATAAAAGIQPWQAFAVGARTEVLAVAPSAGEGECSTAVRIPGDGTAPETIQTWDWHGDLATDGLLHHFSVGSGREVKLFTEFGTAAKIGVNDAGLGLHFNILSHGSDSEAGGVPVHAVARRILEEATTLADAREIAASARVSASTVFTVAAFRDGVAEAASIEVAPAGIGIVHPNDDGWVVHTNHFLDPVLAEGDTMREDSTTRERYAHTVAVSPAMTALAPRARAAAFCGGDAAAPICMRPDRTKPTHEQWGTLLTIALDLSGFALDVHAGTPDEVAVSGLERF
ncbi:C45 family peptidase [Agromyces sp. SYSU K20354]|uniref:C45 family autoproteolytic acyltransferase/hydolase n=1 Tax=Agromyces cavernae TaxID=2898659 RepID=UPI001E2D9C15|nr:C45 family peptidase [Agromyces cavernae]MCD2442010.1 C45 family peptidase [Agromyces cavernae]